MRFCYDIQYVQDQSAPVNVFLPRSYFLHEYMHSGFSNVHIFPICPRSLEKVPPTIQSHHLINPLPTRNAAPCNNRPPSLHLIYQRCLVIAASSPQARSTPAPASTGTCSTRDPSAWTCAFSTATTRPVTLGTLLQPPAMTEVPRVAALIPSRLRERQHLASYCDSPGVMLLEGSVVKA